MDEGTIGGRIFLIRAALGEGPRKPMALRAFAELLTDRATGGRKYHASQISGWETGAAEPPLSDVQAMAGVDPLQRGAAWLAFGAPAAALPAHTTPQPTPPVYTAGAETVTDASGPSPHQVQERARGERRKTNGR